MNISNSKRAGKLIVNLIFNPDLIVPYIMNSIITKKFPIDLNMPWWSYRAIEYADKVFLGKKIFEFGTGGSTLRYAKICKSITSVEDNQGWLEVVRRRLNESGIKNVELIYKEFDFKHSVDFESSEYLLAYDYSAKYDVVIIDGQDETFEERIKCFKYVEPTIKDGGIIVVDDWWRYTDLLRSNRAKSVKVFESVGPCRYGVTSTAFFHY